jgi:chitin biosynthesis protein CHS5
MLVSLTVGKVDAGMAVLLTEDKRIIEFPSILLPPDITSGSIVDITVARNHTSEAQSAASFGTLQDRILQIYGTSSPKAPVLRVRNTTQTAIVLEWDTIELQSAEIRSLSLFRNDSKVGTIPKPLDLTTTKISGLAIETDYTFQLVLRTTAGTFPSQKLTVRTHSMTNLSGITITLGLMPSALRASLLETATRVGARIAETVRIDTTHFVCTEARGPAWERARDMNIPVVVPDWLKGCESEGRIVGVRQYYLDADPRLRQMGPSVVQTGQQQQQQQQQAGGSGTSVPERPRTPTVTPQTKVTPPTPEQSYPPEVPPKDTPRRNSSVSEEGGEKDMSEKDAELEATRHADHEEDGEIDTESDGPKSPEPHNPKKATVEDAKEEDASFHDVVL